MGYASRNPIRRLNMKFVAGIIFGVVMVVFIFQNVDTVAINFLFWQISISRALVIFIVFLVGVILGALFRTQYKTKVKSLRETTDQPEN
jgi:putative membrane protein